MSVDRPSPEARILAVLRDEGWDAGARRLRADGSDDDALAGLAGWSHAERGELDLAAEVFARRTSLSALARWNELGLAYVALRRRAYGEVDLHLDRAASADDPALQALCDHLRGTARFHQGDREAARQALIRALAGLGLEHPLAGRVLDTLGAVYAALGDTLVAEQFFQRALASKQRHGDDAGSALTHGQLGRVYAERGELGLAERHFREDLALALGIGDELGASRIANQLARLDLMQAAARPGEAAERIARAARSLDEVHARAVARGWAIDAAFAAKDRASVALAAGAPGEAATWVERARVGFTALGFGEGLAHLAWVEGELAAATGRHEDALEKLGQAASWFSSRKDLATSARIRLRAARVEREAGRGNLAVRMSLLAALDLAETCRNEALVREVEIELRDTDPAAYWRHAYGRVRGRRIDELSSSLISGAMEVATVLYLDLLGSTQYALGRDPGELLRTFNQMMTEMEEVLRRFDADVSGFRGDGFLALVRGEDHAARAVHAALALFQALDRFNEPRQLLGLPVFASRIGVATGAMCFGNVGTYDKIDFSCLGSVANLGSRIESRAFPGTPAVCDATWAVVRDRFRPASDPPRREVLKGFGEEPIAMWDVLGPR